MGNWGSETATETLAGAVRGTPGYMSPEQARGVPMDKRTDLFNLGAVLYEMLTGRAPFQGNTSSDLIADILRGEPAPIGRLVSRISKSLQSIVARALAKNAAQRYQSAEDLFTDLRQFQRDADVQARPGSSVVFTTVSVLLIGLAVGVFFWLRKSTHREGSSPRSLAVLPFRNLKPDPDSEFLGFSLADEVIAKLGYVKALTVRPSSAIKRYREGAADLRKAAADLSADMLLTGTYSKDGDDLRIIARLIGSTRIRCCGRTF